MRLDELQNDPLSIDLGSLDYAALIRRIGRGAAGSRHLDRQETQKLFSAILANLLPESVVGAVIIALRVKGESCSELLGALDALENFIKPIPTLKDRPVVSLPSYNGARNLPNFTWLLALLLARQGLQVIVHGMSGNDNRTHTEDIVSAWGTLPISDPDQALDCFEQSVPAFVPLPVLSPALARMLERRNMLGVRNTAHSLVKLMNPTSRTDCLRLTCFTHPEFETLQHEVFEVLRAPAMILRATEGEVVANVRRPARVDLMNRGFSVPIIEAKPQGSVALNLPERTDIQGTVEYMKKILSGVISVPPAIAAQVDAIVNAARLPQ